ncbi:Hydroxyacylglutathione hydrolase [Peribacillus sp. Bi96]|uniref:MBL fold metallo-hydrolase n=1 Tax=unclassified Peribacillus TaxID=2675266 RepID=UPI001DC2C39E|nr:MBL fold metallo-hydrolase [Peribacillus sp. Bi96]CAH0201811.1 Hydroxyacylglutathione hydrolase [Peribacillus sp. Bi96]
MQNISELGYRISLIDGFDLDRRNRTGTYVIADTDITLVETSASPSIPHLIKGLNELGIALEDITSIILTHIHLDHAGGAGLFLQHCPNAKVIVHPKGARHLEDPTRLIAGAKAVYGEEFNELFNPILPIPFERMMTKHDRETLQISDNSSLIFYDTPGHANHHLSIYDSVSKGIFSGDTVGIYYRELDDDGLEFYLPSTSPNQFNPEAMLAAAKLYESLGVERIYFGHYGVSENPNEVYKQLHYWLPKFVETAKSAYRDYNSFEEQVAATSKNLFTEVTVHLGEKGITSDHPVFEIIAMDLKVCSMGLIDYLVKQDSKK